MPVHRSWPTLALLLVLPGALSAQRVAADISIGHGPIAGRVIIGDPYPHYPYHVVEARPRYRYRPLYRPVVVIERHRGHGWYRHHGYRTARIWYDADRHSYYEHYDRNHPGLREVVVYEQGGRYYRDDRRDDRYNRDGRYDRDDRDHRGDRDGRNDDRRDDDDRWDRND